MLFDIVVDKTPTSLMSLGETVFGGRLPSPARQLLYVYHVEPSRDSRLVITSSSWRSPFSKVWAMGEFFKEKFEFKDKEYLEFSKLTQVSS